MIIGGLAVALIGRPRTTRDVDLVVLLDEKRWPRFLELAQELSFTPRIDDALAFAGQRRVLLLHHTKSGIDVDISFAGTAYEIDALERSVQKKMGRLALPLPTPEDLIVLKGIAHRPIDLHDIRGLLEVHPDVDKGYIRRWLDEFAQLLEEPEIYEDTDGLLRGERPGNGGKRKIR